MQQFINDYWQYMYCIGFIMSYGYALAYATYGPVRRFDDPIEDRIANHKSAAVIAVLWFILIPVAIIIDIRKKRRLFYGFKWF